MKSEYKKALENKLFANGIDRFHGLYYVMLQQECNFIADVLGMQTPVIVGDDFIDKIGVEKWEKINARTRELYESHVKSSISTEISAFGQGFKQAVRESGRSISQDDISYVNDEITACIMFCYSKSATLLQTYLECKPQSTSQDDISHVSAK